MRTWIQPLALVSLAHVAVAQDAPAPTAEPTVPDILDAGTFAAWRDHIVATPDERQWAELPWLMSFSAGLATASEQGKPLLLWTMNGHPFGCT